MKKNVILVTGQRRAGKDTISDYIVEKYGYTKDRLADPLKQAIKAIFGWTDEHVDGNLKELIDPIYGISPRQAMMDIGTEWAQYGLTKRYEHFDYITGRNLWINRLCEKYKDKDNYNIVVCDVRFPHEIYKMRENLSDANITIINIKRGLDNNIKHESEALVNDLPYDYTISNNDTIESLFMKVDDIIANI